MSPSLPLAVVARRHAAARPDDLAVVDPAVRWTWAALDRRADAAAAGLAAAGVRAGERVALLAAPSAAAVAVLHGIARIGATAAPLGTRLTVPELAVAAAVLRPVLVLHDAVHAGRATALAVPAQPLDPLLAADPAGAPPVPADTVFPAVAILTSGTTGRPKAALLSAAALVESASAWSAFLPPAGGWLLCLGLGHVAGLGIVSRAASGGVPLVVLPEFDPGEVRAALAGDPAPTHVSLVPTQLTRLLDATADASSLTPPPPSPPGSLRAVLLGGGPIPPALVTRALEAGWPVVPTYGLSEAGSGVTALATVDAAALPGSAGRALPRVEVRIEDPGEDGIGEILVRTPARFEGYLNDPAATRAAISGDGWLRTGDLGWLDANRNLFVADRRTDLIVSGGENVAPAEVEAALVAHPAVADAGVIGRADPDWGLVPVAAVVLRPGAADPGDVGLRAHCRERLAIYKTPAAFIRLPVLPRTASGKLRRAELRAIVARMTTPPEDVSA